MLIFTKQVCNKKLTFNYSINLIFGPATRWKCLYPNIFTWQFQSKSVAIAEYIHQHCKWISTFQKLFFPTRRLESDRLTFWGSLSWDFLATKSTKLVSFNFIQKIVWIIYHNKCVNSRRTLHDVAYILILMLKLRDLCIISIDFPSLHISSES